MTKFKKLMSKIVDALDCFCAYILTLCGVMASQYMPAFRSGEAIDIRLDWQRLVLAGIVALLIIGQQEKLSGDDKTVARYGRRKRFGARMINALAQGIMWAEVAKIV